MQRIVGLFLLVISIMPFASASVGPEIDPAGAVNAVALIAGALLVIRGTRKR